MKINFKHLAILSIVSVMYPWVIGESKSDCIRNCKVAECNKLKKNKPSDYDKCVKSQCNEFCSSVFDKKGSTGLKK